MGRPPCCEKVGIKKGPWTPEEDIILVSYIQQHGPGNWRAVPANTGLLRCSKSCRLRWTNYLRPGIKRGNFTLHEEGLIIHLQALLGNKWAAIASHLPQRTDNDIKNYWNTHLKKKLKRLEASGLDSHQIPSVSKRFNHSHEKGKHASSDHPRILQQKNSSNNDVFYASSAENISRLLEGWKRSTKVVNDGTNVQNANATSWATINPVQCYRPQIEKVELGKTEVEFEPILSYDNVTSCSLRWDKSAFNNSEKEVQDQKAKMENNNNSLSSFDNWLLYETMAQVEELIQLPSIL